MMRNLCLCAFAMIFVWGCTVFQHPHKEVEDFERDRKECEEFVANNYGLDRTSPEETATCVRCDDIKRCLEEQMGWKRVKN